MPVEHKPSSAIGNTMEQAFRAAGVVPKQEQPTGHPASSAGANDQPAQTRAQPDIQKKAEKPMSNENQSAAAGQNYSSDRRTTGAPFATLSESGARRLRPISRSAGSVRAKELEKAVVEEMKISLHKDGVSTWAVQTLDSAALNLPLPSVVLLQSVTSQGIEYVSMFSILIDSQDVRLPSRVDKVDGKPIETPTVPGDIYNSTEYISRATELVKMTRQGKNVTLIDAGGMVLPNSFDIEKQGVHGLLYKASLACWNTMNNNVVLDDTPAYTLIGRNSQTEQLIGRLNFSGEYYVDEVGHPVRSDVIIEMDSSRHQQGREFLTASNNICKVACFIEPVYAQPQTDPNNPNNQPFYAQAVITRMQNGYDAQDPEMVLLDVVASSMIQVNNGWADSFRPRFNRPRHAPGDVDFRDIGALGYCTQAATKFDSSSDSFKTNFPSFMRDYFRLNQGIIFAMDIPEVGPDAWTMDIFRAAAGNNTNAIAALKRAANNLTGGKYDLLAQRAGDFALIVDTGNRIHNGYYPGMDGQLHDIREVDLLAVANLYGKTNPKEIMDWAESFSPNVGHSSVRMQTRLRIIDDALQGRQVITGYSGRYIIHPKFLEVLSAACREAGLVVNPANLVHGLGSGLVMGGYDYGAYAAGGAGSTVFGGTPSGGGSTAYQGRGRW